MRTLDGAGAPTGGLRRDLALLWRLLAMLVQYATVGGRLRRAYRKKEARGEVYWLDAQGPTQHRERVVRGR